MAKVREYLVVNDITVSYVAEGKGPPVLFLHGWGGTAESFAPVYQELSGNFTVISIDFPGFGESSQAPWSWGVGEFADLVKGVIEKLSLGKVHVVAHSFGGRVAIWLAAHYPKSVGLLILVNSAGLKYKKLVSWNYRLRMHTFNLLKSTSILLGLDPLPLYRFFWSSIYPGEGRNLPIVVNVSHQFLEPLLPRISSPTLLIWGNKDRVTPLWFGQKMEQMIPNAGLVVLSAEHYSYLEQLQSFNRILQHFLMSNAQ